MIKKLLDNILKMVGFICVKLYKPFGRRSLDRFLDNILESLDSQVEEVKVLNIGSGGDVFQKLKNKSNFKIVQLDIDPDRNPDIVCDASNMKIIDSNSFDYVFAMEVLEHIPTPHLAVSEINRVLKNDGHFIFSTPFIFPLHDEPYDFFRYTKYGLEYLLRDFSYVSIKEKNDYIHSFLILLIRMIVLGNKYQRIASLITYLFVILSYPFWFIVSCIFNNRLATTGYLGIARKRL